MQDACPPAGRKIACPVLVAPMAMQRLAHPDGELATSRAAAAEGIPMVRRRSDDMHLNAAKGHTVFLIRRQAAATRKHCRSLRKFLLDSSQQLCRLIFALQCHLLCIFRQIL